MARGLDHEEMFECTEYTVETIRAAGTDQEPSPALSRGDGSDRRDELCALRGTEELRHASGPFGKSPRLTRWICELRRCTTDGSENCNATKRGPRQTPETLTSHQE